MTTEKSKSEFLALLKSEYELYCSMPSSSVQIKNDKKQFINGLMTASRIFGVSFEELKEIIYSDSFDSLSDERLDIPPFIRNGIKIKS